MKKIISLQFLILWMSLVLNAQGTWTQLSDCSTTGRYGCAGFVSGNMGYLCGGTTQATPIPYIKELLQYNPTNDIWITKDSMPFQVTGGVTFVLANKAYYTTGTTQYGFLIELYSYNPTPNLWSVFTPFPGTGRNGAVAFTFPSAGYVGLGTDGLNTFYTDLWAYNPVNSSWSAKTSLPGQSRSHTAYFCIGTQAFVVSGNSNTGWLSEVWMYESTTDTWSQKANFPGTARIDAASFVIGNYGYIFGGQDTGGTLLNDFWQYDPATDTWTPLPSFPGVARKAAAGFGIGTKGYIVAGYSYSAGYLNDLWCWTPSPIGIMNVRPVTSFSLYPDPNEGSFHLTYEGKSLDNVNLEITTPEGQVIYTSVLNGCMNGEEFLISLPERNSGLYILQLKHSGGTETHKMLIVK